MHGQPGTIHGVHGRESFALWHRAHLVEFERALRAADRALGGDGNVALPYWDFIKQSKIPAEVRSTQPDFHPELFPADIQAPERLLRASDEKIGEQLASFGVESNLNEAFKNEDHFAFASTRHRTSFPSLEAVSNDIHVIVGGNGGAMGGVAWCAFDLVYWLAHANLDRLYESYLVLNTDSEEEFSKFQETQQTNHYTAPLVPFLKPDDTAALPTDYFDISKLEYSYDELMTPTQTP